MGAPRRQVCFNGRFVPEDQARVSIYDSALMFGDMVFEMTRSFNGRQFLLRSHLERLYRGIKELQIPIREGIDEMEQLVLRTMEVNQPAFLRTDEHRIMIDVSRGPLTAYRAVFEGNLEPTVIIADVPISWSVAPIAHLYDTGVHAVTPVQRAIPAQYLDCKIKNRSRLHYQTANQQVSLTGDPSAWALLLDPDGFVAEGTGANFFIVSGGGLMTPEGRNILRGTRRMYVLDLARRLGIPAEEGNIELYDVIHADEAFFTSTPFSLMPCTKVNGLPIGDGAVGPMARHLLDEWSKEAGVDIVGQAKAYAAEMG
jgi:branched-chain amino acid aminotransferase